MRQLSIKRLIGGIDFSACTLTFFSVHSVTIPKSRAEKSSDWLRDDQRPKTVRESYSILINAKLRAKIHLHSNPRGINMVISARTKIERQDVQMPISRSVVGIFCFPLERQMIAV